MDPLDTMTATDWRRVYERSQEYVVSLLKQGVAMRRREAELVDRLRRREERVRELEGENQQLSEQAELWAARVDRLEDVNRTVREARDRERLAAALSRAREIAGEET
ncbi:hypothetical protein GCM10009551_001800 [Nocardiopsis tropica]|uniref:hypothetical protein n=1 Tax=Nocardiopsis tropica TaxID=109330 RepID=UPI0031DF79BC